MIGKGTELDNAGNHLSNRYKNIQMYPLGEPLTYNKVQLWTGNKSFIQITLKISPFGLGVTMKQGSATAQWWKRTRSTNQSSGWWRNFCTASHQSQSPGFPGLCGRGWWRRHCELDTDWHSSARCTAALMSLQCVLPQNKTSLTSYFSSVFCHRTTDH